MIGLAREWASHGWADATRMAASLGLFAGHPADSETWSDTTLFNLAGPRARPTRGWRATRSPSGIPVLLHGWIDNQAELAANLGTRAHSAAQLYSAAFDAWGDRADSQLTGVYTTLMPLPDGRIRMARSPLGSFPLFYAHDRDAAVVCSIPRPIFAAGWPQKLRPQALADSIAFLTDEHEDELSLFEGMRRVPDGAIAYLSRDGVDARRWYDVLALPPTRLSRDEDYVEAANALLADSVRNALAMCQRPGIALSGGLDSAIAADEVLRQLPAERRLPAFTFHPLDEWNGPVPARNFADERPHVRAFAAMHPRLDVQFIDNRGIGFDYRARDFFLACSTASPAWASTTPSYGVCEAAAAAGVDVLLGAHCGNMTFSNTAPWAFPEFLLRGKWHELWRLAAGLPGDERPIARRIIAHGLMPLLPAGLRDAIRRFVHRNEDPIDFANTLLKPDVDVARGRNICTPAESTSQRQWLANLVRGMGLGTEGVLAEEQVFGLRFRDIAHYRPLMEFCFTIPTDQFVRNGVSRWLARRMAVGRMPEAQRTNRLYGRQNADWFARLGPRVPDMRRMVERLADQPELAPYVDTDRALALLDNWPEQEPEYGRLENELSFTLPGTLIMSQYVDFITGRNAG